MGHAAGSCSYIGNLGNVGHAAGPTGFALGDLCLSAGGTRHLLHAFVRLAHALEPPMRPVAANAEPPAAGALSGLATATPARSPLACLVADRPLYLLVVQVCICI